MKKYNFKNFLKVLAVALLLFITACGEDTDNEVKSDEEKGSEIKQEKEDKPKENKPKKETEIKQEDNKETEDNSITVSFSSQDIIGYDIDVAEEKLKQLFTNVEIYYDDENVNYDNFGKVSEIYIDNKEFKKGDKFDKNALVEIVFKYKEMEENPYGAIVDGTIGGSYKIGHLEDSSYLGWDDYFELELSLEGENLDTDDYFFEYDDNILSIEEENVEISENGIKAYYLIKSKTSGSTDLYIKSSFLDFYEQDSLVFDPIHFNCLDEYEGQTVYITNTGTKYHLSPNCAGESSTATTLIEAEILEYQPCGKCAR